MSAALLDTLTIGAFGRQLRAREITAAAITEECLRAVTEDEADVIVLGCAGMADLCARISAAIGVPVVDGVAAATKMVESLVTLGLVTSKRLEYAPPPPKPYTGLLSSFALEVLT